MTHQPTVAEIEASAKAICQYEGYLWSFLHLYAEDSDASEDRFRSMAESALSAAASARVTDAEPAHPGASIIRARIIPSPYKGLIERVAGKKMRDTLGEYEVPQYVVPLPVHMQWCDWCAENCPEDA